MLANKFPALRFCIMLILGIRPAAWAEQASGFLTTASAVLSLSIEQASHEINISITGVVTAADPDWGGSFFVQDSSGGVFVENTNSAPPVPGDLVTVSGTSAPGGYAPIISHSDWKKLGLAPLPQAKLITAEQLMSGTEDSQRVKISGIVRNTFKNGSQWGIELSSGGYRFRAYSPMPANVDLRTLVGAKVCAQGTVAVSFSSQTRNFVTVAIFGALPTDFIIEKPVTIDPFTELLTPFNGIVQYRKDRRVGSWIHVKGVVTFQKRGEELFLRDATGGLRVKSSQAISLAPGDAVEAIGFPGVENYLPVLEDAIIRKTSEAQTAVAPRNVSTKELLQGWHQADFITQQGRLLDRMVDQIGDRGGRKTVLILQTTHLLFAAEEDVPAHSIDLASIPIGSVLTVSGICLLESDDTGKIKSFRILLPSSDNVRIVEKASWFSAQHLLIILAGIFPVLVVAGSWTVMASKKNSALSRLIHDKETAQKELQQAHATLEQRVKERTQQLKFQITARKESELQFKAVLTERTRLAQELHDTLEQTQTGVAIQLGLVAKLFQRKPRAASYHLKLVRNMMRQSQIDLRRSIWDLRCRQLEEFDLPSALAASGQQLVDGSGIRVVVKTKGTIRPLPEVVEENLLRIGQEALTNVVKHSNACLAEIHLEFSSHSIILEIKDDGKGFTLENCVGPNDGHFGLLGMSERAKRAGGSFRVSSIPGKGTTIHAELPVDQTPTRPTLEFADLKTDYEEEAAHSDSSC